MKQLSALLTVCVVVISATGPAAAKGGEGETVDATMLLFQEQDKGTQPYRTRTLITERYLRSDSGGSGDTYVLFDRDERTIYSVTHYDKTILVIPSREVDVESPIELELGETSQVQPDAPEVAGKEVMHHRFTVNDKSCRDVIAVDGMLKDAVTAMRSFREVLAGEHAKNMDRTPSEMQRPCSLANNVFAPVRHLAHGFPIREWDYRGHSRALVDYETAYEAEPALFTLPDGYRRYTTEDVVKGRL